MYVGYLSREQQWTRLITGHASHTMDTLDIPPGIETEIVQPHCNAAYPRVHGEHSFVIASDDEIV